MKSRRTALNRKLSIYGFDAVNNGHTFYAVLDFDITPIRSWLRARRRAGTGGSLFVFLLKAIAQALREFSALNSMINHRRTTEFDTVDVSIPIEILRNGEILNKQYLIRHADAKTMAAIEAEINASKRAVDDRRGYILSPFVQKIMDLIPRRLAVFLIRAVMRNHRQVMASSGSVFVTSVSMFSNLPGFVIPYAGGPKAVSFAIGSAVKKPVAVGDTVEIREVVNVTAAFNHDAVDGAPAARFLNRLRAIIEKEYSAIE